MKGKIKVIVGSIAVAITMMGVTIAFYSNKGADLENMMVTKGSSVYLQELFEPAEYWLSGETKQKKVKFGNQGEKDQVIRFRIEEQWIDRGEGTVLPTKNDLVEIKWAPALTTEWTSFPDDNGWYYYKEILSAGDETAEVMEGVSFSTKLSNDSEANNVTHAVYQIVIYMEGLDVNSEIAYQEWDKTFIEDEGLLWVNSDHSQNSFN